MDEIQVEKYLKEIKPLLGITETDVSKDGPLKFAIKRIGNLITNYCNIDIIPEGLEYTLITMAIDCYRASGYGKENLDSEIKSVSRGDTNVSYKTSSDIMQGWLKNPGILNDYKSELNRYRRLRFC